MWTDENTTRSKMDTFSVSEKLHSCHFPLKSTLRQCCWEKAVCKIWKSLGAIFVLYRKNLESQQSKGVVRCWLYLQKCLKSQRWFSGEGFWMRHIQVTVLSFLVFLQASAATASKSAGSQAAKPAGKPLTVWKLLLARFLQIGRL